MPSVTIGLIGGLLATLPMTVWETPSYLRHGMEGALEWHLNQTIAAKILGRPAEDLVAPGLILHFGHGALGGAIFGFALPSGWGLFAVAAGLLYGWFLWLTALMIHRPVTGLSALDHPLGTTPAVISMGGHLVYGLVLGGAVVFI